MSLHFSLVTSEILAIFAVSMDTYKTISGVGEGLYKEKGSKFISYAYHVEHESQVKEIMEGIKKQYYDARHHCYAWRVGYYGDATRANDDGEPSSTAGRPILGQIVSRDLTNVLVVVVRYFGGTKLGVSGLIQAYKDAASDALSNVEVIECTIDSTLKIRFEYVLMNSVMGIIKDLQPRIVEQGFDNDCTMTLSIRNSKIEMLVSKLDKIIGLQIIKY